MTDHGPIHHLGRAITAAAALGAVIILMFLGALHSPEPNDVTVALVGPEDQTSVVGTRLEAAAPGAFDIEYVENEDVARDDIRELEATAAFVPGPSESRLLLAGASGAMSQNALTAIFGQAADAGGSELVVEDLVPLPSGDRVGLSSFLLTMGTLVPSLAMAALVTLGGGRDVSPRIQLAAVAVGTGLLALTGAVVADPVLGALEGNFGGVFGALWLLSFSVAGMALALRRFIGPAGLGLTLLAFMIAGMPTAGGAVGPSFIPEGFQVFTLATPTGEAVPLLRKLVYFDEAPVGLEVGLLAAWAALAVLLLLLPGRPASAPAVLERQGAST
jgi:hypothetical protein